MSNPTLAANQPKATRIAALRRLFNVRGLAFIVMVAIVLQAFFSPGQRMAARAHFHFDAPVGSPQDLVVGHSHGDADTHADADADADTQSHPHPHPHSHTQLATHEHDVESNDVVYVDTQNSEPPSGQASSRVALDLDGLLLYREPPSVDWSAQLVFAELALRFRSRVEPPPERPPRVVI